MNRPYGHRMSNKRIDVTRSGVWNLLFEKFDGDAWGVGSDNIIDDIEYLVRQAGFPQELKRCYERIDELSQLLEWIYDSVGEVDQTIEEMDQRLDRVCDAIESGYLNKEQ